MAAFTIRDATQADANLLRQMVCEAVNWPPDRHLTLQEIMAEPGLVRYVDGWMLPTDSGAVAIGDGTPIGAAWLRYFTADHPAYGYVDDGVPELSIAVVPSRRGEGVGRALLRAVRDSANARGVPAISLSVERANPARQLYMSEGFSVVASGDESDVMLASLA